MINKIFLKRYMWQGHEDMRHSVKYLYFPCALHCAGNKINIIEKARQVHKTSDNLIFWIVGWVMRNKSR